MNKRVARRLRVPDTDLSAEFILDNLAAGRSPEDLVARNSALSLSDVEAAKKAALKVAIHDDQSAFRASLRIRHIIAALQPHPLVNSIRDAFDGVRLGHGPSLRQMEVIDDYGADNSGRPLSPQEYKQLRDQDETQQWTALKLVDLDTFSYFAYADAESFRFYIPARLIYCLTDPLLHWEVLDDLDLPEHSREARDYQLSWYSLLNAQQRRVISRFLWHALDVAPADYHFPRAVVAHALEDFWLQYLENPSDPL